jgi:CubicO group peptidase (beta-lactamase class C family)
VTGSHFEPVRTVFDRLVAERPGAGLALSVYYRGEHVVDLCGDPEYTGDSLQLVFSVTKGLTAICTALLIDRGQLDPDAPVAVYWPEFGAAGKDAIPVRSLLSHQAGLPTVDGGFTLAEALDGEELAARLAAQRPYWEPGTRHGYHTLTFGTLAGELIRRVTGRSLGEFFAAEIAGPLGADAWIGLPAWQDHRYVPLVPPPGPSELPGEGSLLSRSFPRDFDIETCNKRFVRAASQGAFTAVASARGLSRLYAACIGPVGGIRLLSERTVTMVATPEADGDDLVNLEPSRFGLGFQVPFDRLPLAGPGSFGHDGMGGALAFASPRDQFAFAFVTDRMPAVGGADPRTAELVGAVTACARAVRGRSNIN